MPGACFFTDGVRGSFDRDVSASRELVMSMAGGTEETLRGLEGV